MSTAEILTVNDVQETELDRFLQRAYGSVRANFLRTSGNWRHHSAGNRWVVRERDEIAGYCAVIPGTILVGGAPRKAIWWVDLIVAPEHRGRGLQTLFDQEILSQSSLKLGFPNALAARIHRRHGWGVREDFRSLLLPLRPNKIRALRQNTVGRAAAKMLEPVSALLRRRYRARNVTREEHLVERADAPDLERLVRIAQQLPSERVTTLRNVEHLGWRYAEGPDHHQHRFYIAATADRGSVALITRTLEDGLGTCVRILDLFGDLNDKAAVRTVVWQALSDAVATEARQVTVFTSDSSLQRLLQRMGFLLGARARFCWHTEDDAIFDALSGANHWVLGDSDNDLPT